MIDSRTNQGMSEAGQELEVGVKQEVIGMVLSAKGLKATEEVK